MTPLEKLQQRLIALGHTLTPEQCKEFRDILDELAKHYYTLGEVYKLAVIDLIPSKLTPSEGQHQSLSSDSTVSSNNSGSFKPATKNKVKGDPLAELVQNLNSMKPGTVDLKQMIQKLSQQETVSTEAVKPTNEST